MDQRLNPFAPGAGVPPHKVVGRDTEIQSWEIALERIENGLPQRPFAFSGLRGVGKTVLLAHLAQIAEDRDWMVARLEAGSGKDLRSALGQALYKPLAERAKPSAGKRLLKALKTALSFQASYDALGNVWNFGVDLNSSRGGGADSGILEPDVNALVEDLSAGAAEEGGGLVFVIDEAQSLDTEELATLCAVAHAAAQRKWSFLLALGGLPGLPRAVAEARSYAERLYDFYDVGPLTMSAARDALVDPVIVAGASWQDGVVDRVITETCGYPFFVQQFGHSIWTAAHTATISARDVEEGHQQAIAALDRGFFRSRWERATPAEQSYLRAMSIDNNGASLSGDVASRLGRTVQALGPVRSKLIGKGLVYAPEHGHVAFTVPLMAEFIARQPLDE